MKIVLKIAFTYYSCSFHGQQIPRELASALQRVLSSTSLKICTYEFSYAYVDQTEALFISSYDVSKKK